MFISRYVGVGLEICYFLFFSFFSVITAIVVLVNAQKFKKRPPKCSGEKRKQSLMIRLSVVDRHSHGNENTKN